MLNLTPDVPPRACARCATELPPATLACPVCGALLHRERLEQLATLARTAAAANNVPGARTYWQEARDLVPPSSEQYRLIAARLAALTDDQSPQPPATGDAPRAWRIRALGAAAAAAILLVGKLKFLLLGLGKLSTLVSMFGFIAVYWSIYGWPLAVGVASGIYVHEMGHVAMLRRLGIRADAPLFIPGVGAMVMLRERVTDPLVDARIGLAGPVWGLAAAIAAWIAYAASGAAVFLAIAELTAYLNLFNLIPVWQLDGSRGFHVLSQSERWMILGVIGLALWITGVRLLWIVGAVVAYRTIRGETGPGHRQTLLTFAGLVLALAWLARAVG